jgi:hypothetical protein
MALPEESVDMLRRLSGSLGRMPRDFRLAKADDARQVIGGLRKTLDHLSDDDMACVSFVIATVLSTLAPLPVADLAATLDKSTGAYSLAAAGLLKLYDLEADPDAAELASFGGYL